MFSRRDFINSGIRSIVFLNKGIQTAESMRALGRVSIVTWAPTIKWNLAVIRYRELSSDSWRFPLENSFQCEGGWHDLAGRMSR